MSLCTWHLQATPAKLRRMPRLHSPAEPRHDAPAVNSSAAGCLIEPQPVSFGAHAPASSPLLRARHPHLRWCTAGHKASASAVLEEESVEFEAEGTSEYYPTKIFETLGMDASIQSSSGKR